MHGMRGIGWALVAWLLAVPPAFSQAAPAGAGLDTKGDLSIRVVVEPLSPEARGIGLDREALQLRVEKRVRDAGLVALDDAAYRRRPDAPKLSITVVVADDAIGARYGGEVKAERPVASAGGSASSGAATVVWRKAVPGGLIQQLTIVATEFFSWRGRSHEPGSRIGHTAYITDAVLATVDDFCAAFLAANGR